FDDVAMLDSGALMGLGGGLGGGFRLDQGRGEAYEHLEYSPLISSRAHGLGGAGRQILNAQLRKQYTAFLQMCARYPAPLPAPCLLEAAYYLTIQERVQEAAEMLEKVPAEWEGCELQRSYLRAFLLMFRVDEPEAWQEALRLTRAQLERNAIPSHWRIRLEELAGTVREVVQAHTPSEGSAAPAPSTAEASGASSLQRGGPPSGEVLEAALEGGNLNVRCEGFGPDAVVKVKVFNVDVEMLFSTAPFSAGLLSGAKSGGAGLNRFAYVEANHCVALSTAQLDSDGCGTVALPEAANGVVEVTCGELSRSLPHCAHRLALTVVQAEGILQVNMKKQEREGEGSRQRPIAGAYVKVYAHKNGKAEFHKDGYTDLLGRFDYMAVSSGANAVRSIRKFAILVVCEAGAVSREVLPPHEFSHYEEY
ncbi:hypothetical protein CYMTET_4022, partial [Cymbomonas tetramitiformis]